jgi:hypothetical protein
MARGSQSIHVLFCILFVVENSRSTLSNFQQHIRLILTIVAMGTISEAKKGERRDRESGVEVFVSPTMCPARASGLRLCGLSL